LGYRAKRETGEHSYSSVDWDKQSLPRAVWDKKKKQNKMAGEPDP